jgi:hypothetical protein
LYATQRIPAGTLLWTADLNQESSDILTLDEMLSMNVVHRRQWADYTWAISGLFFGPRRDLPVEEAVKLEASHFLNHCCDANVGFASDTSIVAMRDIDAGEMISNDYAMTEHLIGFFPGFECRCGAPKCRGEVGPSDWRIPELQQRYKGFFTSQVEALIESITTDFSPLLQKTAGYAEFRNGVEVRAHYKPEIGKGLFATQKIKKGDLVCFDNQNGFKMSVNEIRAQRDPLVQNYYIRFGYQTDRNEFCIPVNDPLSGEEPEAGYYMNHSCEPTTVAFGKMYVAFKDIEEGEEITYDYATSETHFDRVAMCHCGSKRCRGKVTGEDWKLGELQQRYPPSSWAVHVVMEMFGRYDEELVA